MKMVRKEMRMGPCPSPRSSHHHTSSTEAAPLPHVPTRPHPGFAAGAGRMLFPGKCQGVSIVSGRAGGAGSCPPDLLHRDLYGHGHRESLP